MEIVINTSSHQTDLCELNNLHLPTLHIASYKLKQAYNVTLFEWC